MNCVRLKRYQIRLVDSYELKEEHRGRSVLVVTYVGVRGNGSITYSQPGVCGGLVTACARQELE